MGGAEGRKRRRVCKAIEGMREKEIKSYADRQKRQDNGGIVSIT